MAGLTAPIYVPTPGYTMTGRYRKYVGDGDGNAGSIKTQMDHITALTGQPIECVMISSGLNLQWGSSVFAGCVGSPQHFMVQVPLTAGNGLAATIAGTNTAAFKNIAQLMVNAGIASKARSTVILGWESTIASSVSDGFDWAVLHNNQTTAQYAQAFQIAVTAMRSVAGFNAGFCYDTGYQHGKNMAAAYPGDAYVDYIGLHPYNGIYSVGQTPRNNVPLWLSQDLQVALDGVTNFARQHGKLCMASEYALEQPISTDTSSNTYTYHTVDTDLYFPFLQNYFAQNADVWVGICYFDQNQYSGAVGSSDITEINQMVYVGTDPATQTVNRWYDTAAEGTAYYGTDTEHNLSRPTFKTSVMIAGSMQSAAPVTPPTPGGSSVSTTGVTMDQDIFVF